MTPRLNSNWTKEHVEELISMFNIPRDDPKLANPEYINYLHELFVKDRQERARLAAQQAATANSRTGFGIPTGTASSATWRRGFDSKRPSACKCKDTMREPQALARGWGPSVPARRI